MPEGLKYPQSSLKAAYLGVISLKSALFTKM